MIPIFSQIHAEIENLQSDQKTFKSNLTHFTSLISFDTP